MPKSLLQRQKKPNTDSLRGREAGTSTRDKSGKQVGSKSRRKRPISAKGIMAKNQGTKNKKVAKKKSMAYKLGEQMGKAIGIKKRKPRPKPTKKSKVYTTGKKKKF